MSKLAMNSNGFNIVGGCCGLRCVEVPQEAIAPASVESRAELSHPLSVSRIKGNAFVSRCIVSTFSAVCAILRHGCDSKVGLAIIKGFSCRNVVNLLFRGYTHDFSVHENARSFPASGYSSGGVVGFGVRVPVSEPVPLHKPVVVVGVNYGVEASGKRNEFYRLVRRLLDSMTFNSDFHSAIVAL